MAMFTVYLVTNMANGKRYVGVTKKTPARSRWVQHIATARQGSNYWLHAAIRKYGAQSFVFEELVSTFDRQVAYSLEVAFIWAFGTFGWRSDGYNQTRGGAGNGRQWTVRERHAHRHRQKKSMSRPEVREKIKAKRALQTNPRKGKKSGLDQRLKHKIAMTKTYLEFRGESLNCTDWSARTGIARRTIHQRIKHGWSVEEALLTPVGEPKGLRLIVA